MLDNGFPLTTELNLLKVLCDCAPSLISSGNGPTPNLDGDFGPTVRHQTVIHQHSNVHPQQCQGDSSHWSAVQYAMASTGCEVRQQWFENNVCTPEQSVEIFIDIVEHLDAVIDRNGTTISAEIEV